MPDITARREHVAAWLTANGIAPDDVPLGRPITETTREDGTPVIQHTAFLREDGKLYADSTGDVAAERREVDLVVPWDTDADTLWTTEHRVTLLQQIETRPGDDAGAGQRWMEARNTGRVLVACNCGYTSGWVRRSDLPDAAAVYAEHSTSPPDVLTIHAGQSPDPTI
ncbi:hypothetical protein [Streptomyces sp. NPDC057460]|uniref:hypothetical protein n=1 Tax=Streptomyces sp. NPDC057460 TaxID=3346141 RepID=UPI003693E011